MTSKKFVLKSFTIPHNILLSLQIGAIDTSDIADYCKVSKQSINYWLVKLCKESLVHKSHRGYYEITMTGKNLLSTLVKQNNKELVRLENMRFKYPIYSGIENFLPKALMESYVMENNVRIYTDRVDGHSYRIFATKYNPCIEVTCMPRYGYDIYEMYYFAREDNQLIAKSIADMYNLKLGLPEPSMKPEWAIPSPLAESVLENSQSSQIRTSKGVINRSKGRKADIETRDIRLAQQIFALPETLEKLSKDINKLGMALSQKSSGIIWY